MQMKKITNSNIIFKKQLDTNIITFTYICPYLIVIKSGIAFGSQAMGEVVLLSHPFHPFTSRLRSEHFIIFKH
jgi:hypothetical protein